MAPKTEKVGIIPRKRKVGGLLGPIGAYLGPIGAYWGPLWTPESWGPIFSKSWPAGGSWSNDALGSETPEKHGFVWELVPKSRFRGIPRPKRIVKGPGGVWARRFCPKPHQTPVLGQFMGSRGFGAGALGIPYWPFGGPPEIFSILVGPVLTPLWAS